MKYEVFRYLIFFILVVVDLNLLREKDGFIHGDGRSGGGLFIFLLFVFFPYGNTNLLDERTTTSVSGFYA
jgi:hypothetical protein